MIQVEVFTTLGQTVADATVIAQVQVNNWLKKHPEIDFEDARIETHLIREAPEINWCVVTLSYAAKQPDRP
jgi:hypothetical protein